MFLLLDLCCLNLLRVQRIMGFFYLNYPQISQVVNSDHVVVIMLRKQQTLSRV